VGFFARSRQILRLCLCEAMFASIEILRNLSFICCPTIRRSVPQFFSSRHTEKGAKIVKAHHQFLRRYFIIKRVIILCRSRDSSVGIATSYGLDHRGVGVRVPVGSRIFSTSELALGSTQHPIRWVPGGLSSR
jgi:hypothetical protein